MTRTARRRVVAAALVAAALVSGCGSEDGTAGRTAIRVQVSGEPEETAVYELMAAAFEREAPGVSVELDAVAKKSDHLAKLATAFAGGNPPDVFLVNYREYAQFVTRGAVRPFAERGGSVVALDRYYRAPIEAFTLNGSLQCAPSNASSAVIFFNNVLFARAGLRPPAAGWTWADFAAAARAMTVGGLHGVGIEPAMTRVAPFVWSAGGEIVDDRVRPTRVTLASSEARRALEFLTTLVRDGLAPSREQAAAQSLEDRFAAGRLGMLMTSRREVPGFRETAGLDFDVAPLPIDRAPATILHSDGFCVSKASRHAEEAMAFVRFAISEQGQTIGALSGRIVPSLRSVATGPFLDPVHRPEHDEVFLDQLQHARSTPVVATWPEIETVLEELLERLFHERGYGAERFAREADERTRPLLAEAAASP